MGGGGSNSAYYRKEKSRDVTGEVVFERTFSGKD